MGKRKFTKEEREKLDILIKAKELAIYRKGENVCPSCSSLNVIRNGVKNDNQRMYCNDCEASFTLYGTEKHESEMEFLKLISAELPARDISKTLDMPVRTVYQRRAKVQGYIQAKSEEELEKTMQYAMEWKSIEANKKRS